MVSIPVMSHDEDDLTFADSQLFITPHEPSAGSGWVALAGLVRYVIRM